MIREIVFYPDSRLYDTSHPAYPGTFPFQGQTAEEVEQDLLDTLAYTKGVAIAGVQIGVPLRVMAMGETVYWNPVVVNMSQETIEDEEGCLSLPGVRETLTRPYKVHVLYRDRHGVEHDAWLSSVLARAALHEIEHMEGKLLTSGLSPAKLKKLSTTVKQLRREARASRRTMTELIYGPMPDTAKKRDGTSPS